SAAVSPNPSSVVAGNSITFSATVTDTSSSTLSPSGSVSWSDGGAGGSFSPTSCSLSSSGPGGSSCPTTYTASTAASSVTIPASYLGDGAHSTSSGTSSLTVSSPAPH